MSADTERLDDLGLMLLDGRRVDRRQFGIELLPSPGRSPIGATLDPWSIAAERCSVAIQAVSSFADSDVSRL